ncbi:hypothetical protein [Anaerotignum faecicola]
MIARIESGTATLRLEAEDIEALFHSLYTIFEHAADGQMCVDMLSYAEDGYYDLIPMDIQMPILNGYEATKKKQAAGKSKKSRNTHSCNDSECFFRGSAGRTGGRHE